VYGTEIWALNRSEKKETETAEIHFLRLLSGYTIAGHVLSATIRYALQINAFEEGIQYYTNKWHNHILRMDSLRPRKLGITNKMDEEMLDDRENDCRIVFDTEQANKYIP
jgi:hypothetical protein